jgi:hypothetical protein
MISSNVIADTVGDVLSAGLEDGGAEPLLIHPSRETIEALVTVLGEASEPPHVRLFAAEQPLKDLLEDFLIASGVADLIDAGTLSVRALPAVPNNALLVSEESIVSLIGGPGQAAGLATTDDAFVEEIADHYESRWAEAEAFSLRTPPRSTVLETLEADIGPEVAADFRAMLDSLDAARGVGEGLDEVTISLLVAARNRELLYDISRWGEDIGLASKATFSRTKTRLEERGLLDTEKVPIDVGRPRLRLLLDDERLEGAAIDELAIGAQEMLA